MTTNIFISLLPGETRIGSVVEATSSTAGAYVELRMQTVDVGTNATNLTRFHIEKCLEVFKAYLRRGGNTEFNNTGTKQLPDPAPPPALAQ
jgi:hypothetical protein